MQVLLSGRLPAEVDGRRKARLGEREGGGGERVEGERGEELGGGEKQTQKETDKDTDRQIDR